MVPAVNASDILATYGPNYALNASYDVLNLRLQIAHSYTLNASTAVYVLNASNPYLPTDFGITDSVVYPASMIQKDGVSSNFFTNVVVDGPWYASNYTTGDSQMLMLRNQYFKPLPAICQINASFTEVEGLDAQLVQSGATDLAEVTYATASALLTTPNVQVMDEKGPQMQDLQYNVTLYPFNMTSFRQAMVYGINQSAILQTAFNGYGVSGYTAQGTIRSHSGTLLQSKSSKVQLQSVNCSFSSAFHRLYRRSEWFVNPSEISKWHRSDSYSIHRHKQII